MKIKPNLLIIVILIFNFSIQGQNRRIKTDSIKIEISNLKLKNQELNLKVDYLNKENLRFFKNINSRQDYQSEQVNNQVGLINTAFGGISAELSSSSNFIGAFGIIITIISVLLGVYITKIERNIKSMKSDNETLLQKNIKIRQELESLSDKITKDSTGLYKIIHNEESNYILNRLISVPEDINNLFSSLTSRDLIEDNFLYLKEAFMQIKGGGTYDASYLILFFQHFSGLSTLDDDIKSDFIKNLKISFSNSYKNDVIKSINDFFNKILKQDISNYNVEINNYIVELGKSKFKVNDEIYFTLYNTVKGKDLKFKLYNIVSKAEDTINFRKKYGKLIADNNFEDLSEEEKVIIDEINNL
jgi:hypothetical protein